MRSLDAEISKVVRLCVLASDIIFLFNRAESLPLPDGKSADLYNIDFYNLTNSESCPFRQNFGSTPVVGERLSENYISFEFPIEITKLSSLLMVLLRHQSNDLWEHDLQHLIGTLKFTVDDDDDHGVVPLMTKAVSFEIDKVTRRQLAGREAEIVKDLELVAQWSDFLGDAFMRSEGNYCKRYQQAAAFVLRNFATWDLQSMQRLLLLCSLSSNAEPLVQKFPEAFADLEIS